MTALVAFGEVIEDASRGNGKLPRASYRSEGLFPVVDQGKRMVAGFSDDASLVCKVPSPVIVFGDHTRALKFVDFPFIMGADGVKVLRVREGWHPKFVFHYLRFCDIPSAGYSRHYKFLKEVEIPQPPVAEQHRIAALLDEADALSAKRRRSIRSLDDLVQATFSEMFASRTFPSVSAGELMPVMRNGLSPATAGAHPAQVLTLSAVTQGVFDPDAVKPGIFAVEPPSDKRVSRLDFLMCRGNGNRALVGVGAFSHDDRPDLVFPDTVIAGRINPGLVNMQYLEAAWRQPSVRRQIERIARTTNGTFKVNQKTISSVTLSLPPLDLQREFSVVMDSIDAQRADMRLALAYEDDLVLSLQFNAFRGGL